MTKKQLFTLLALSTMVLTQAGSILADDVTPPVDSTTPGVVTPKPSTPVEPSQPTPETPVDPTVPSTPPEKPSTPDTPAPTPSDPTVPEKPSTPSTEPSTDSGSTTPGGKTDPTTPSTEDGKKDEQKPDTPTPTPSPKPTEEQPKTTDEANKAGKSQVGTTSTSTGQVVQDVAPNKPVYTENGYTIVGVQDSHPVIANGDGTTSVVEPEVVGATVNADKTVTVSTATGEKKTLPHTGEKEATLLVAMGMTLLAAVYGMKRSARKFRSK
ncbi:LPXTG cell wall anchor domain-containing protein [Streptococcus anginosus]|uniref:LPXTG cell wall anchor domain-containing protein n=2 Tax=Streptococcus anginosus group TaxID=671232 RepID=UPI00143162BF|nr:LPXTG cell wall anchor domain-containing protein [Streptococcus anginosus]NJJ27721.1 LPXTG cell wall anchor domain-containing protein [Streptococcus anginosus]